MRSPSSQDAAVSPAIGTILLVALTVVFVAVAAVVATGLANGMFDMKQVGLTLKPYAFSGENPEHGIGILVHGGKDAGDLVSLSASVGNPALTYNKNESVSNPQIGVDYRFAAYVDPVVIEGIRNGQVILTTAAAKSAAELERYVTVTGTFRDGTQQVLLIQKVLIPAIPGNEGYFAGDYVKVLPYYIDDTYLAHGFIIEIINKTAVKGISNVEFLITYPKSASVTPKGVAEKEPGTYTYDISPISVSGMDKWDQTPYPDNKFWILGTIKGNVTITLTPQNDQPELQPVTVPLEIPPQVSIFDNRSRLAGTITYENNNISLEITTESLPKDSTLRTEQEPSLVYYFIKSGKPNGDAAAKGKVTSNGGVLSLEKSELERHRGEDIEAYVKVSVKPTEVWYRVASVSVNSLL